MAEGIGLTKDLFTAFSPATFGTCRAWFRADSLVLSDGDAVGTWADQSGNAYDLTQTTGANKPLYKTGIINGKPALLYDGSNDTLATAAFGARSHPVTVFVVAKRLNGTNGRQLIDGIASGNRMALEATTVTGTPASYSGSTLTGIRDVGSDPFVIQAVFDGASSKIYLNDLWQATGTTGSNTLTGITVGSSYAGASVWDGYIAEVIYFDGSLSFDNYTAVRNYLMAKYAIAYFSPSGITGFRSWFCADHIRGLKDGDAISEWSDSYGSYDVVQATGANQPLFKKDIQNHHAVVRFDGSNDFLRSASFTAAAQPRTIFAVCKHNNTAADHYVIDGIGSSNRNALLYEITTGKGVVFAGSAITSASAIGTSFVLLSAVINGASSALYQNGTSVASGDAGSQTLTGYTVGARYNDIGPMNGDIAEILIYDAAPSTTNRQLIESALIAKYGL